MVYEGRFRDSRNMFFNGMELMERIIKYISYVLSVWSVITTVWILSAKNTDKKYDVKDIRDNMVTKEEFRELKRTIDDYIFSSIKKDNELITGYNKLKDSYALLVANSYEKKFKPMTFDEFKTYMNGIQWVVSPIEDKRMNDTIDFKIKIRKKQ
jgi:hypothetical protein